MSTCSRFPLVGILALGIAPVYAQGPAIHGFNGTVATEATIKDEHKAANKIVVATEDGAEHVYDAAKGLVVHGGTDPLSDLKPGTTVIIHYTADNTAQEIDRVGVGGLSTTEGIATMIDRGKKEITVRYENGTIETLKLTDRAAAEVGKNIAADTRIIVYYSDEAGTKVTHYFKKGEELTASFEADILQSLSHGGISVTAPRRDAVVSPLTYLFVEIGERLIIDTATVDVRQRAQSILLAVGK